MCHYNEMYWESYLSYQTNTQTVISLKNVGPGGLFGQNGIDITLNNDQTLSQTGQTANDRH